MSTRRFTLRLPCHLSSQDALGRAAAALHDRQVTEVAELRVHPALTTSEPGMCTFTFTYEPRGRCSG
ncbi:hypothetical protein LQ384_27415 [Rhodococcus rhodochrous]|uniref:Uncharacterized protein n=1 Tax=Rhodococcus rhodochrous TaxID=1829 RepID=A0AAW4XPP9_RHORH|nr:hypothetical protein [Rhodococcus rhodochrous]MCD2114836.1 hypothetical protein [Rhodococcus rhodochrous]